METENLLRRRIAEVFRRELGNLVAGLTRVFGVQGLCNAIVRYNQANQMAAL